MIERRTRRPNSIFKSEQLIQELDALLQPQGWSYAELSRRARVSDNTVLRIFDLDNPRNVRGTSFSSVVSALTNDIHLKVHLFELAKIPVPVDITRESFGAKLEQVMADLNLDSVGQHLLEEATLSQVQLFGRILKGQQSLAEQLFDQRRIDRSSRGSNTA